MSDVEAKPAVMTMTLEITRASTGKVDVVELICTPVSVETKPESGESPCQ